MSPTANAVNNLLATLEEEDLRMAISFIQFLSATRNIHSCKSTKESYGTLRDKKDIPILNDALHYSIDLIMTGDKDFLEAELRKPMIYSPSMMYEYMIRRHD